jgi:hypothetical protein
MLAWLVANRVSRPFAHRRYSGVIVRACVAWLYLTEMIPARIRGNLAANDTHGLIEWDPVPRQRMQWWTTVVAGIAYVFVTGAMVAIPVAILANAAGVGGMGVEVGVGLVLAGVILGVLAIWPNLQENRHRRRDRRDFSSSAIPAVEITLLVGGSGGELGNAAMFRSVITKLDRAGLAILAHPRTPELAKKYTSKRFGFVPLSPTSVTLIRRGGGA